MANYMIARFDEIDAVSCPCGSSRRAFVSSDNPTATMHIVDIEADAKVHGCHHRAIGKMRIINVSVPAFDREDEWFD